MFTINYHLIFYANVIETISHVANEKPSICDTGTTLDKNANLSRMKNQRKEIPVDSYESSRLDKKAFMRASSPLMDISDLIYGNEGNGGFYKAFEDADYILCNEITEQISKKRKELEALEYFVPAGYFSSVSQDDLNSEYIKNLKITSEEAVDVLVDGNAGDYGQVFIDKPNQRKLYRQFEESNLIVALSHLGVMQLLGEEFYSKDYNQHNLQTAYEFVSMLPGQVTPSFLEFKIQLLGLLNDMNEAKKSPKESLENQVSNAYKSLSVLSHKLTATIELGGEEFAIILDEVVENCEIIWSHDPERITLKKLISQLPDNEDKRCVAACIFILDAYKQGVLSLLEEIIFLNFQVLKRYQ